MILKSGLRETIKEILDEHDIAGKSVLEDLVDALVVNFGDEIYDDEEESDEGIATLGDD